MPRTVPIAIALTLSGISATDPGPGGEYRYTANLTLTSVQYYD